MRGSRFLRRRAWALAFLAACGAIVATYLGGQSEPVTVREPLVPRSARGPLVQVPLEASSTSNDRAAFSIRLAVTGTDGILAHDELRLFVSSEEGGERRVRRAEARTQGGGCRFEAADVLLVEDQPLSLRRARGCTASANVAQLELVIEAPKRAPLGLWAHRPREGSSDTGRLLVEAPDGGGRLSVRGFLVDHPPTAPRVELLNAMWRISPDPSWIWWSVVGALGALAGGCLLFPTSPLAGDRWPRAGHVLSAAIAAALPALGLAALYAVLMPPLFGPDEPYHLLGFAQLNHDDKLAEDTVALMGQTHVLRIRYRPTEHFRTVDVGTSFVADDDQLKPTEVEMRSATLARLWRAVGPVLHGQDAPHALLILRLVNALAFAFAVGLAAALSVACAGVPYPQWLSFPFFFVPSLPFFAMHVSETAVLCSAQVVLAASLAVLYLGGARAHWAGLPLGLSTALMLAGGRSPWPLAAIVAAALGARVVVGADGGSPRRAAAVFWTGAALGLSTYWLVLNEQFLQMVSNWSQFVPGPLRPLWDAQGRAATLVIGLLAIGAGLEIGLQKPRAYLALRLAPPLRVVARWCATALVACILLSLAGSLVFSYPDLPLEPRHAMGLGERVTAVLSTMATLFRLKDPNFLLATSFWVGFGWLDAIPGPTFQALLVALTATATVGLLRALSRPPQLRRLSWLLSLTVGGVMALVLYTVVTQNLPMALQGRYLIGWYLIYLTLAASWLTGLKLPQASPDESPAATRYVRPAVLLLIAGGIHVYCLSFILRRYF
jgi:hypothetical protein